MLIQDENKFDVTLNNKLYYYYTSVNLYGHKLNDIIDYYEELIQLNLYQYDEGCKYVYPEIDNLSLVNDKFKQFMKSSNSMYHYTSFDTALKILDGGTLRFNNISNQTDPNETMKNNLSTHFASGDNVKTVTEDANKFGEIVDNYVKHHQCICFSTNTQVVNSVNVTKFESIINRVNAKYNIPGIDKSHYKTKPGYEKHRMWEKYANNFAGVCLIFDKNKLMYPNDKLQLKYNYINYLSNLYGVLYDKNEESKLLDYINETYFHKHSDFRDENEFRFLINSENTEYLDISNALVGIIYGPKSEAALYKNIIKNSFSKYSLAHIKYIISRSSLSNHFVELIK